MGCCPPLNRASAAPRGWGRVGGYAVGANGFLRGLSWALTQVRAALGEPWQSNVSDEGWSRVAASLPLQREDAGEREHDRRTVFDGLPYIVKTGAPWRWMPNDFPPGAAVDQQAERWLAAGRKAAPTAAIIDSRTPRSTRESAGRAGYDQGKRRKGSKIHRPIDTLDGLIRVGRIPYEALSDVSPDTCRAMATQAKTRGAPGPTALMTPYSLVRHSARTIGTSPRAGSYGPDISAGKASPSAGRGGWPETIRWVGRLSPIATGAFSTRCEMLRMRSVAVLPTRR